MRIGMWILEQAMQKGEGQGGEREGPHADGTVG